MTVEVTISTVLWTKIPQAEAHLALLTSEDWREGPGSRVGHCSGGDSVRESKLFVVLQFLVVAVVFSSLSKNVFESLVWP